MTTSTKITAFIIDALNTNPNGFTIDANTGEVISHGICVGGYHKPNGSRNWLRYDHGVAVPFEVLQEHVESAMDQIESAGYVGGWAYGGLVLDIVELYDCLICSQGIPDATAFIDAQKLGQDAIGWLCPTFTNGYKEVIVNG